MANTKQLLLSVCLILLLPNSSQAKNKKETYFSCKNGYQFESKKTAARCIKQRRLSFRPLSECSNKSTPNRRFKLEIDRNGVQDRCVVDKGVSKKSSNKMPTKGKGINLNFLSTDFSLTFIPSCPTGYVLRSKRGKDSCSRGNPETITAPTRKVTL